MARGTDWLVFHNLDDALKHIGAAEEALDMTRDALEKDERFAQLHHRTRELQRDLDAYLDALDQLIEDSAAK